MAWPPITDPVLDKSGRTVWLTYNIAASQQVSRIVELERMCCAFLDFEFKATADAVELSITAPAQEGTDAQWFFAQFLPQSELTANPAGKASECACCRG